MLGFAMRAGRLVIGTDLVCRSMARGEARLVLIAADVSSATRKRLSRKAEYYGVSIAEPQFTSEELGKLLGKTYAPATVAVTDEGFAPEIKKASI